MIQCESTNDNVAASVGQWQIVEITRPEVGLRYTNARLGEHVG
ncbi:MAG: hypothetical protein V7646_4336 [Pseudonocardia sp.]